MNAVVKKQLPVLDAAGLLVAEAVLFAGGDVAELVGDESAVLMASELQQLNVNATSAHDQATRIVVESNAQLALAGDLMKSVNAQITTVDETRKARTRKIDAFKASISGLFGGASTKLTTAKALLQGKMNDWGRKEQQRIRDEEAAERKLAEERALALASAQQAMGDTQGADQIIQEASEVIAAAPAAKLTVRGGWGTTTSSRQTYSGEVTDTRKFLVWLLAQEKGDLDNVVDFKKSGLNTIAKNFKDKEVPGFKNKSIESFGSR